MAVITPDIVMPAIAPMIPDFTFSMATCIFRLLMSPLVMPSILWLRACISLSMRINSLRMRRRYSDQPSASPLTISFILLSDSGDNEQPLRQNDRSQHNLQVHLQSILGKPDQMTALISHLTCLGCICEQRPILDMLVSKSLRHQTLD